MDEAGNSVIRANEQNLLVDGQAPEDAVRGISVSDVRAQLERILASRMFQSSERLRRLLQFTVEQTLRGQPDQLKEYLLGIEVFGRKQSFDPRIDPIVRVEAGRLRLRLKQYYDTEGQRDPVWIEVPKGRYVPVFRKQQDRPAAVPAAQGTAQAAKPVPRVIVLPFADYSPNQDQQWFCAGIAEELINALAKVPGLRVVARASGFPLNSQTHELWRFGEQLRADTVVEGSVRKSGDRLRITVQVVNLVDGCYLWSETYDREMKDVFAIQEDISRAIVDALKVRLARESSTPLVSRHTDNLKAYNLYLKGRYYWNTRTEAGLRKAIESFRHAIAEDPRYALAYAGLADSYTLLGNYGAALPTETGAAGKAAALRAVELNHRLAEAHASLAHVKATYDWDWTGAQDEYEIALDLNPGYPTTNHWYAVTVLSPLGRLDEAMAKIVRAQELDPMSLSINRDVGVILYYQREYEAAMEQCHKTLLLDPTFYGAYWLLGLAYEQRAMYQEAVDAFKRGYELSGGSPRMLGAIGHCYAIQGKKPEASEALDKLAALTEQRYVSPFETALIHIGLRGLKKAFEWLQKVCTVRSYEITFLKVDPRYDILRSDKQFPALLNQVGLRTRR